MLTGGVDFSAWKWVLKEAVMEGSKVVTPEVAVNYGNLIAVILDSIFQQQGGEALERFRPAYIQPQLAEALQEKLVHLRAAKSSHPRSPSTTAT